MYTAIDKLYKASKYAQWTYGNKITLEQLKTSIKMMTRSTDPKTVEKYLELALEDNSPLCHAQFKKLDVDRYMPTPDRPKTPNELLGHAYENQHKDD
jgi:benzoyl-CoA reductase/2-hydroxyglutaryl-CoA dehydratase subunit BcrC/BadD/HgdB